MKKIKYRIYKFVDGNNDFWYEAERKICPFWWSSVNSWKKHGDFAISSPERKYHIKDIEELCQADAEKIRHYKRVNDITVEIVSEKEY